jgi:hypothetical protein
MQLRCAFGVIAGFQRPSIAFALAAPAVSGNCLIALE